MMLPQNNFIVDAALNGFHFQHFGLQDIMFKWNHRVIPAQSYNIDWGNNKGVLDPCHHYLSAVGINNGNSSNALSLKITCIISSYSV